MRSVYKTVLRAALVSVVSAFLAATISAQQNQGQSNSGQPPDQGQQNQQSAPQGQQNEEQATTPIPAYHSPFASAANNDDSDEGEETVTPDARPLAGAQNLSLGTLESNTHDYWQPHVDIAGTVDSNPQEGPNATNWSTWTSISGGLDFHRTSGNSDLMLTYLGGGMIANDSTANNGIVQQLGISTKFQLRRWTLSFFDQVSYLPGAEFGYAGLGGSGLAGGSTGVGTTFGLPSQGILTGLGQSVADAFTTEADVNLTPRTSLTFVGGYSLLRYFDSGLLNFGDADFRAGYNYLWTRRDTVAVFYTYSALRYNNSNQSIDEHTIQASYARRVTGRLAFQVAVGPQIVLSRLPISSGSNSGAETSPSSLTQLYWALNSNLMYQLERTALGLGYNHGVAGGSGVLGGSVTDIVSGSATRQMSRTFSSGVTAGYSRNAGVNTLSTEPASQTYNYWFVGANFTHPVGRALGLTFAYQMQYQDANSSFCIGTICGKSVIRNLFSFGIAWHERPLLF